jgi:hypothetical protein
MARASGGKVASRCLACERARLREWYASNRERKMGDMARARLRKPERMIAALHVHVALAEGRLRRTPCWVCGSENSEAHHPSYSPDSYLDVIWLCRQHHRQAHRAVHL